MTALLQKDTNGSSRYGDFEARRERFEQAARKDMERFYGIALPQKEGTSGILYAPNGTFQIIDHFFACSSKDVGIFEGSADGKVLSSKEMQQIMQCQEFLEIQVNVSKKEGGIFIEESNWLLDTAQDSDDWVYLLFRVISNVSLQQVSNFVIFYDPQYADFDGKIKYIRLDNDGYSLLRGAFLRMAKRRE